MFNLPHNCTHLTCQQSNVQNSPSQTSTVHELRTSRCSSWIQKRQGNQRSNCQHLLDHRVNQRIPENIYFCFTNYTKAFGCVDHNKLWKILQEMGIPDHLTCLMRNLGAGQEATVRTGQGTTDWFQIGKGVRHPAYLTYMQSTSCKMPGWMKHKLESSFQGEISITSNMQMTPPLRQEVKRS